MPSMQSRRCFLTTLSLAGAAGLARLPQVQAAEGPLETTTVRFLNYGVLPICLAPQSVAENLLRAEGFTDIRYVQPSNPSWLGTTEPVARGEADFDLEVAWTFVPAIEAGQPITILAGVLVGCYELFAQKGIRGIADLKGKSVGVQAAGATRLGLPSLLMASVGLDPAKDIDWVLDPALKPLTLFEQGKIDAFLGFPPEPQDLRARQIGHVIVNTAVDLPWSQYFCCMMYGNTAFVQKYPVATKRAMRAILKAADICAADPARVAKELVDNGLTPRYDFALQTLSEVPYDKWREYDAEDTVRFYALRLREAGFIKATPQKIIAGGTDWRFLNELKRELKA
jgi:NitT/TauT family transport system substrate-binding protein